MFRPPPTVVEIGTEADIRQYEELIEKKMTPVTPPKRPKNVFQSPDMPRFQRKIISTPTGSIDSSADFDD